MEAQYFYFFQHCFPSPQFVLTHDQLAEKSGIVTFSLTDAFVASEKCAWLKLLVG